jgi:hypothetical protein
MKRFGLAILRAFQNLTSFFFFKTTMARRALLRTEARERDRMEAERLDRLRNPHDYRGR